MFKNILVKIALMSALLLILASCAKESSVAPAPERAPVTRFGYPVEQIKQTNACFDILIEYPFFGRPQLDQEVRLWVDAQHYDGTEELLRVCAESPVGKGREPYQHKVDYEIFKTRNTVSVVFKSYTYVGGAHGMNSVQPLNLAVESGNELRFKDLFATTNGLYTFFSDYVYQKLYPKLGDIWQGSPMFTEGLEPVEGSFKNFAITEKGLILYFPTYQIAPYSEGTQVCEVPLTELVRFKPKPGIWQ